MCGWSGGGGHGHGPHPHSVHAIVTVTVQCFALENWHRSGPGPVQILKTWHLSFSCYHITLAPPPHPFPCPPTPPTPLTIAPAHQPAPVCCVLICAQKGETLAFLISCFDAFFCMHACAVGGTTTTSYSHHHHHPIHRCAITAPALLKWHGGMCCLKIRPTHPPIFLY